MHLSNYLENKLLDKVLRAQAFTPPATMYFALLTSTAGPRADSTAYVLDDTISVVADDTFVHLYKCTTAGTTAAAQGSLYSGSANEVVTDGTAAFTEQSAFLDAGTAEVEPSGGDYARVSLTASLANFSGTQGAGTTTVSSGSSGQISNNAAITWPTPSGTWGSVWGVAVYDASSSGNLLLWGPMSVVQSISATDAVSIGVAGAVITMSGCYANYLRNKLLDYLFRAQTYSAPATTYLALFISSPTATTPGSEVAGTGYARVGITSGLAAWAGTQSAGSTSASSGSSGTTSNNAAINFPTPTASWGTVTSVELLDASTAGNRLLFGDLTVSKSVEAGNSVPFPIGALSIQFDN